MSSFLRTTLLIPLLAGILLFIGCGNPKGGTDLGNDNPVFQKDSLLRDITMKIAGNPKDATLFYKRGSYLHKIQYDSLALKDFKMASSLDTNNASYYSAIGDLLFENHDLAGSVTWIQKAISKNPSDKKAHLKIAKLFLYIRDYAKAFAEINNNVLRVDVHNPEAYFLKGMIYKDLRDTDKAISSFQTAIQESADYRDAVVQLGLLYSAKKDPLTPDYLDKAYMMDSSDVMPIFAKGVYYQELKDTVRAKEEYKKCILKNHHYANAYFNMGYLLLQQDSVLKAWRQFDLVVKNDPRNPTGYYNRGVCSEIMDSVKSAISDYKIAASMDTAYKSPKNALKRLKVKI